MGTSNLVADLENFLGILDVVSGGTSSLTGLGTVLGFGGMYLMASLRARLSFSKYIIMVLIVMRY